MSRGTFIPINGVLYIRSLGTVFPFGLNFAETHPSLGLFILAWLPFIDLGEQPGPTLIPSQSLCPETVHQVNWANSLSVHSW